MVQANRLKLNIRHSNLTQGHQQYIDSGVRAYRLDGAALRMQDIRLVNRSTLVCCSAEHAHLAPCAG